MRKGAQPFFTVVTMGDRAALADVYASDRALAKGDLVRFDLGGLRELLAMDLADLDGTVDGTLALTGVPGRPRIDAQATLEGGVFLGMEGLDAKLAEKLGLFVFKAKQDGESKVMTRDFNAISNSPGSAAPENFRSFHRRPVWRTRCHKNGKRSLNPKRSHCGSRVFMTRNRSPEDRNLTVGISFSAPATSFSSSPRLRTRTAGSWQKLSR